VIMSEDNSVFQCICGGHYRGKYCHIQIHSHANTSSTIGTTEVPTTTTIPQTSVILDTLKVSDATTSIVNTIVESTTTAPTCTYQTCQLGNCLTNGTCHCRPPATGEFCEKIDECLILKCVNGYCVTGKGCICTGGFFGSLCEMSLPTATKIVALATTTTTSAPTTYTSTIATSTTTTPSTTASMPSTTASTPSTSASTPSTSTTATSPTTPTSTTTEETPRSFCENGGIYIDNICICLNQFTGDRCEIFPGNDENKLFEVTQSLDLNPISPIQEEDEIGNENTLQVIRNTTEASRGSNKELDQTIDKLYPLLNKFHKKAKALIEQDNWPWFECFPNSAKVTVKIVSKDEQSYLIEKPMSELKIGDFVMVSKKHSTDRFSFSRVITFLHKIEGVDAEFKEIVFSTPEHGEQSLLITPGHLIYSASGNSDYEYKPASQVRVGDLVEYHEREFGVRNLKISDIRSVMLNGSGIYAPLTENGNIIVDNIHASCYAMVKSHSLAQFAFSAVAYFKEIIGLQSDVYLKFSQASFNFVNFFNLNEFIFNFLK